MSINEDDLHEIENWVSTQQFLPQNLGPAFSCPPFNMTSNLFCYVDKSFICTFILGCEGDLEKTKSVLSNYFYARQSVPEIFTNRDPLHKDNVLAWKSSYFIPLTGTQNGCRVYLGACTNSDTFDFVKFAKQVFSCFDLLIKAGSWGNGDRMLVLSYEQLKMHNLQSYTLYVTRKVAECERDKYLPGKLRMVHNVFLPPFMKQIHERFKPHLSLDDERQIMFHRNLKSLHKFVSPNILPLEYGGSAGSVAKLSEEWYRVLVKNREFFKEEEDKRMQETRVKFGAREKISKKNYDSC